VRFGLVHRVLTNALAALGVLALLSGGQFSRSATIAILASLALAVVVPEAWQRNPKVKHLDGAALVGVLLLQIVRYALGADVIDVLIEFAMALQIVRVATRRGAVHDQQVILLALLHLVAGTILGGGLGYALCFLGVVVVAPGALVLSHLRREVEGNYRQGARDRTGHPVDVPRILRSRRVVGRTFLATMCLLSLPILVFTSALFVFFPRVGLSLLALGRAPQERMVGFSPRVDLGQVGVLRDDRTLAMRISLPPSDEPPAPQLSMHLRGTALDHYDGRAWSQSQARRRSEASGRGLVLLEPPKLPAADDTTIRIDLEPIDPQVLFTPPDAVALRFVGQKDMTGTNPTSALRGPEGELRYQANETRGTSYEVVRSRAGRPSFERLEPGSRARYLQLPRDMAPRIRELAERWTDGLRTAEEKLDAIQLRLQREYAYDRNSPSGRATEPLDDFLFESKRGHCEYFSTALAVLGRAAGVPTRNVTGFIGGTYNRFGGFYVIRQGDAHSWTEAYLDGRGWITYDPTPPAGAAPQTVSTGALATIVDLIEATSQRFNRHVVSYDLEQQVGLLRELGSDPDDEAKLSDTSPAERSASAWGIAIALALGGTVAVVWWRRRKGALETKLAPPSPRAVSMQRATALYEELEGALGHHGIARPAGTPPLRHAEALVAAGHPLGDDTLDVTEAYLAARFGGELLTSDRARELEARVRSIRARTIDRGTRAAPRVAGRAGGAAA
jgi:transglutaminase-like putative cysteine protease